jgi:hypothetical protein
MTLATQLDLEQFLQADFQNDPDAVVALLLGFADAVVAAETGRDSFDEVSETVTLDGRGDRVLFLPEPPVTAVASVTEDGTALVDGTDFWWTSDGQLHRGSPTSSWDLSWSPARRNVVVDYTHGYATIPDGLVKVAVGIAGRLFQASAAWANSEVGADGIRRISLDGSDTVEFTDAVSDISVGSRDLPPLDRTILGRFTSGYFV